ncbi:MAG: hypothetical protein GAK35_01334 [Herbaspirillum frisingense]|uniref:DUF7661 domain-containing protein n=1 Tax=Herbaspirillum frisingense TaxID=92645 RepID=A0A7V8FY59_9BURK|nr:MAG: hypothetical protein GAK35_01334 [Herbaspirillum frisingense]
MASSDIPLLRFDVFGKHLGVRRLQDGWKVYTLGNDGKLGASGIVIPDFVEEAELSTFLGDLFHESARPGVDEVRRLD